MQNRIKKLLILILFGFFVSSVAYGATILFPSSGGTGKGTASPTDVGKFLKVSDDSPFTYTFDTAGGAPGGSDTQVQYNDGGSALGGDSGLTYNKTSDILSATYLEARELFNPTGRTLEIYTINANLPKDINIEAGSSTGSNNGATVNITAGAGTTTGGNGGSTVTRGGNVPVGGTSDGGDNFFYGGTGRGGGYTGGDLVFESGNGTTGATPGVIKFKKGGSSIYGILDFGSLTSSDKTFTAPDQSGTIALEGPTVTFGVDTTLDHTVDNGKVFTNAGAGAPVNFTLDEAVTDVHYTFVQESEGDDLVVTLPAASQMHVGSFIIDVAGTITSKHFGSSLTIYAINSSTYVMRQMSGTWTYLPL